MARIPTRDELSPPGPFRSGRGIARQDTTAEGLGTAAMGRGLSQLGAGVSSFAQQMRERQNTLDVARAELAKNQGFVNVQNSFDQDGDYGTWEQRSQQQTQEVVQNAASVIRDPELRELWSVRAQRDAIRVNDSLRDQAFELQSQAQVVQFEDTLEANRRLYVDPDTPDDIRNRARQDIAGSIDVALESGLITPVQADRWRTTYIEDADYQRGQLAVERDPTAVPAPRLALDVAEGVDIENVDARTIDRFHALQSAYGESIRIISGARSQEHNEAVGGAERSRHLATHGSDAIDLDVSGLSRAERIRLLELASSAGFTGIGIYSNSLHLDLGSRRAWGPNYGRGSVPDWAENFVERHLNGQIEQSLTVDSPDWYRRIRPSQRQILSDRSAALIDDQRTAGLAEQRAAYDARRGSLQLGIVTGDVASEQQILDADLTDSDKATLIRSFRANQEQEDAAQTFLRDWSNGSAREVNPYDSADRSLINDAYEELLIAVPEESRPAAAAQFIADTGVVPRQAVADVRQLLNADSLESVTQGVEQAAALYDAAPRGLDAVQNGGEIRETAQLYNELVNNRGRAPQDVAQRLIDQRDPETRRQRQVLDDLWDDESETFQIGDVLGRLGDNWVPGGPIGGITPQMEQSVLADYMEFAEDAFKGAAQGDTDLARSIALDRMNELYGVSRVSGQEVVMRRPPENYYPVVDGSQEYIRELAMMDARELDENAQNVMLQAAPETTQDIRAGRMPRYDLWYLDGRGVWNLAQGQFIPDQDKLVELSEISSEERRIRFEIERDYAQALRSSDVLEERQQAIGPGLASILMETTGLGLPSREQVVPNYEERQNRLDELNAQRAALFGREVRPQAANEEAEGSTAPLIESGILSRLEGNR